MRSYLVLNLLKQKATFEIKNRQVFDTFLADYCDPEVSSYIHRNSISDISYAEREN